MTKLQLRHKIQARARLRQQMGAGSYIRKSDGKLFEVRASGRHSELLWIWDPQNRTITRAELTTDFRRIMGLRG